jgi:hypothetical protein
VGHPAHAKEEDVLLRKLLPALVLVLGACSGGGASAPADAGSSDSEAPQASEAAESQTAAQSADEGSKESAASAPGGITLTIGDETWEFAGALCASYNAPAGEPGSEWNVSFKEGNNQVYVNFESSDHYVSITDVVDYGSLDWSASGDDVTIEASGNDIHAEGTFRDNVNGAPSQPGTLDATCASWYEG